VFGFRERMDERIDSQRAVRTKRFVYIRNEMPDVPWGQHLDYLWKMEAARAWEAAHRQGRTDAVTGRFFGPKPVEELYDTRADPDNVTNLADRPDHRATLEAMRRQLRAWRLEVHDTGLLPEVERARRVAGHRTTLYEMARDPKLYDLPAYLDASDLALARDPANTDRLVTLSASADSGLRYWGVVGLGLLPKPSAAALVALDARLADSSGEVAAMAAWAVLRGGNAARGQAALVKLLSDQSPAALLVLNVIDWAKADPAPYLPAMAALPPKGRPLAEYEQRMIEYLRELHTKREK
jgi:hypothetical protein